MLGKRSFDTVSSLNTSIFFSFLCSDAISRSFLGIEGFLYHLMLPCLFFFFFYFPSVFKSNPVI